MNAEILKCAACGASGVSVSIAGANLCTSCGNVAQGASVQIDAAVRDTVVEIVRRLRPSPIGGPVRLEPLVSEAR